VTLTLDGGEGREVNETLGRVKGHVELRVSRSGLVAGADVRFPTTTSDSAPLVSNDFDNGICCVYLAITNWYSNCSDRSHRCRAHIYQSYSPYSVNTMHVSARLLVLGTSKRRIDRFIRILQGLRSLPLDRLRDRVTLRSL